MSKEEISIEHSGSKICFIDEEEFTYISHDLIPQISLFLFENHCYEKLFGVAKK